jgi:signal peptidase II
MPLRGRLFTFLVAAVTMVADRELKSFLDWRLQPGQPVDLVGPLRLYRVENRGAAFGILPNATLFLLLVTAIVVAVVVVYAGRTRSRFTLAALGLVLGGTLSNGWDRLTRGSVLDYFDSRVWPVFNLADAAITVGIVVLLLAQLADARRPEGDGAASG